MISFCPAFLLLLCWITRPALANDGHQHREDFTVVLTLFKEMMKLAKSAASGECFCSKAEQVSNDVDQRRGILDLIQKLSDLVESEATSMNGQSKDQKPNKRVKRFHFGFRRRIAFPPGTKLSVTPTFYLPFVRDLPDGLISNMSISFPFSSINKLDRVCSHAFRGKLFKNQKIFYDFIFLFKFSWTNLAWQTIQIFSERSLSWGGYFDSSLVIANREPMITAVGTGIFNWHKITHMALCWLSFSRLSKSF